MTSRTCKACAKQFYPATNTTALAKDPDLCLPCHRKAINEPCQHCMCRRDIHKVEQGGYASSRIVEIEHLECCKCGHRVNF